MNLIKIQGYCQGEFIKFKLPESHILVARQLTSKVYTQEGGYKLLDVGTQYEIKLDPRITESIIVTTLWLSPELGNWLKWD